MKKQFISLLLILTLTLSAVGGLAETAAAQAGIVLSDYFTKRDLSGEWDAASAVALPPEDGAVTITEPGTYVLTGSLNGSVTVSAGDEDKVQLVLNNVNITAADGACILVENADKTFITLAAGSVNTLTAENFAADSEIDAAIFARDDVTLNGSGALTVVSAGHGIVGKDDLKITGGSYHITAAGRGIDANDSVRIYDGDITIASEKDAIRAKHDEEEKGYLLIAGGSFDLTVGGGAANAVTKYDDFGASRGGSASENTVSAKGLKASGGVIILDGSFALNTADDALHSGGDLTLYGGTFTISAGDDGLHADSALTIYDGSVTITGSYEGIEAQNIAIAGGNIAVTASDDGLNAAGGNDQSGFGWYDAFASDGVSSIVITGGSLYVNAQGDGIDSNGDLYVTGGSVLVSGPTGSGNGALDYNGAAAISGGTVIAAGSAGMAQNFSSESTQPSALVNLNGAAGSTITVYDAGGSALFSGTVEKGFNTVVISSPLLTVGETYTVSSGSSSVQVTLTGVITGGGMGWGNQPGGGWNNNQPGGGRNNDSRQQGGGRRR